MRVEFLGTGGYHPNERRHTACIMLPEIGVVFDAGTSFFRVPERLRTREIDIFLSHAHLDHIAGLTFLLTPMLRGDLDAVRVHGNAKTLHAVETHLFDLAVFPLRPDCQLIELAPEIAVGQGGILTHIPLEHPGGSIGYRIDWPERTFAYITDTTADHQYIDFIRGVDLLIHECYFPDERAQMAVTTGHSNTTPVAELAREAGVGQLVLVHIDPQREDDDPIDIDVARRIFADTILAEDLMVMDF